MMKMMIIIMFLVLLLMIMMLKVMKMLLMMIKDCIENSFFNPIPILTAQKVSNHDNVPEATTTFTFLLY